MVKLIAIIIISIIVIAQLTPYLYNVFPFFTILQYLNMFVDMVKQYALNAINTVVTSGNLWLVIVINISFFVLSYVLSIFFKKGGSKNE